MSLVKGAFLVALLAIYWYYYEYSRYKHLKHVMDGFVDPRFKKVEDTFRQQIENGVEPGGAFAVYYKGELVVDLWGGYIEKEAQITWKNDTLSIIFSASKGMTAILLAKFVDKGYIDYKQLVSHYWPEFAQNGKESITVETLVSHQAGLIGLDEPLDFTMLNTDYDHFVSVLAAQKPTWVPGSKVGYHMLTFGLYVDVLLSKADPLKRSVDQIYREEISIPFGIDYFQGTPYSEQYRAVPRIYMRPWWEVYHHYLDSRFLSLLKNSLISEDQSFDKAKSALKIGSSMYSVIDQEIRRLPCSSFNGYGTARSLAKLYGIIVNGGVNKNKETVLSDYAVKIIDEVLRAETDSVINIPVKIGRGFMILLNPMGEKMFGHPGFGGQMAYGDKTNKIGIAYITNHLNTACLGDDARYIALQDAVYDSIKEINK